MAKDTPTDRRATNFAATMVEADESFDIRRTFVNQPQGAEPNSLLGSSGGNAARANLLAAETSDVEPFCPAFRPPTAILKIMDDNQRTGEAVRLRQPRCVLGRDEGEIRIPNDPMISPRHAEIVRMQDGDVWRWILRDLESASGTFVLASQARLKNGDEMLLGSRKYRFSLPDVSAPTSQRPRATLTAIESTGAGQSVSFEESECWLGRDSRYCPAMMSNDKLLGAKEVLVYSDTSGQWFLKDIGAKNGVWMRVREVTLIHNCAFQLGEQRFNFYLT